jgi:hypothetical protein
MLSSSSTDAAIAALSVQISELLTELRRLTERHYGGPVNGFRAAAEALNVSEDTLHRRRKAMKDRNQGWWASRDELVSWWRKIDAGSHRKAGG